MGEEKISGFDEFPDQPMNLSLVDRKVKVLFIGGYGRSGSTLLARMLEQVPGFVYVGELTSIWQAIFLGDRLCGCGVSVRDCLFWSKVGQEAFGGWDALDDVLVLDSAVHQDKYIPLLLAPKAWPQFQSKMARYAKLLERLYLGIQRVTGARVIVDSSKDVSFAFLLRHVPGLDLRVIHLVRDSRGVAFSWTKRVEMPWARNTVTYMPMHDPSRTGVRWTACNILFHLIGGLGVPRLFVRYEDLVRSTRPEMQRILKHAGTEVALDSLSFLGNGEVELVPGHTVRGNPMRFRQGSVPLRVDEEWREKMAEGQRRLVSLLTWPLLLRYGYLGRGGPGGKQR